MRHRRRVGAPHRPVRRVAGAALWGLALAHLLEALVLRRRRAALRTLGAEASEAPGGSRAEARASQAAGAGAGDIAAAAAQVTVATCTAPAAAAGARSRSPAGGAEVDGATVALAAAEMEATGAGVVDLVPGDLPPVRALRLLRRVDPARLGRDPLYVPGGAHEAVVCHRSVAERMARRPDGVARPPTWDNATPRAMVRYARLAQRYAPTRAVARVAPDVRAGSWGPEDRWEELDEVFAYARPNLAAARTLLGLETAHLAAMTVGLLAAPMAGAAALATWAAQPLLVFGGRRAGGRAGGAGGTGARLRPPGLVAASVGRLPAAWAENVRASRAGRRQDRAARAARPSGPVVPVPPAEGLFDAVRDACPWCGSRSLAGLADVPDTVGQHKPGRFHLDECRDCGHVFQNPALSLRGLDYYYDQAYDGAGEESTEKIFGSLGWVNRMRVKAVEQFTEPQGWLDVGTGYGHFCAVARQRWPGAVFDGLDLGFAVEEAQRRGCIDTAYVGSFPELADGLPRPYDVVSMHHYLEHTRDPRRELAAAAKVLEPGGYLMVEVPDPECPWGRRFGRYWPAWYQPQHQNFVPCANLEAALREDGFEILSVERGRAPMGLDVASSLVLVAQHLAGRPDVPWRPAADAAHPLRRGAVFAAAAPVIAAGALVDVVKDAWIRHGNRVGNTYRLVARKP